MRDLSRRKLLAALPMMTPAAVAALAARLSAGETEHPDAELLRLEAEFELAHAAWVRMLLSDDEDVASMRDEEAAAEACDAIAEAVRLLPAKTLDGLAAKVRVLAWDLRLSVDIKGDAARMDWGPKCFLGLAREIDRMASDRAD